MTSWVTEAVAKFIASHLKKHPTIRGLSQLIDLHIDNTQGVAKENLAILRSFAEALVADKPAYRCNGCGFEGKRMRWHCPVCKDWATHRTDLRALKASSSGSRHRDSRRCC